MIHRRELLRPTALGGGDQILASLTVMITSRWCKLGQDRRRHFLGIAHNTHCHFLSEADARWIDINLNNLRRLWPIIEAVARQCGKRIEARAQSQNHIGLLDKLHASL